MNETTSAQPTEPTSSPAWAWLWVAVWATFVWGLGTKDLSMEGTSRFLGPLIHWLFPDVPEADNELMQFYVRKTAHVTEYGVLAALTLRALVAGRRPSIYRSAYRSALSYRSALLSIGAATAFAVADETRQSLSAVRMGSVWDVALDSVGAAVGVFLLLLWARRGPPGSGGPQTGS